MDTSSLHIAQQSRRDKLRVQQDLGAYVTNFAHSYESGDDRSCRSANICYDPSEFCSEMINFSTNNLMTGHHQEPGKRGGEAPFPGLSREIPILTSFSDPQYLCSWKSSSDWVTNHQHSSPIFVGESANANSNSSLKMMNSGTNHISALDVKPNYLGYDQEQLHSPNSDMNGNGTSSLYQNALQELVTSSNDRSSFGLEFASLRQKNEAGGGHGPWVVGGSELLLLPDQMRFRNQSDLMSRSMAVDGCSNQWRSGGGGELHFAAAAKDGGSDRDLRMVASDHSHTQALSLSLSSVPSPKVQDTQIAGRDFQTRDVCNVQDSRNWNSANQNLNLSTGGRILGAQQALAHRNAGPLGPFTGYATILRSSKFLRPAQQLLEELCCISRPKNVEICGVAEEILEVRVSSEAVGSNAEHAMRGAAGGKSGMSSFVFDGSDDRSREPGGTSGSSDSYRPENLQRKAKLVFMQDEVGKRYKQYHQQMQMVVSSFESVAGLSAATPYVSLALKMISKHFWSLKSAIADQIRSMKNVLGEELSSPSGGTSGGKGNADVSMLKFFDQNFHKQKGSGNNLGILEGQHIWRPQRGLPERAVSVLRAWLFDHFLHPYPTDTDKHMLATQTGLTRNQVSNWFINARVRVWKPMVEEIHMLETKGPDNDGKTAANQGCERGDESSQSLNRMRMRAVPEKQVERSIAGRSEQEADRANASVWNQEKRSRIEYHMPGGVGGSLMGLVPSHRSGAGGGVEIGSVSLTLGLRQSAENAQQERHLRHYGGLIGDFVG